MRIVNRNTTQTVAVPSVDAGLCRACRRCAARETCRTKALVRIDRDEPPFVDAGRCLGCRACILACPHGAVHMDGNG